MKPQNILSSDTHTFIFQCNNCKKNVICSFVEDKIGLYCPDCNERLW